MKKYFDANTNNQLIHFTSSLANIISILESESLRLKYCQEEFNITYSKAISKSVHPMVCFSEQDITQLDKAHITYGRYGIAFNSQWIIANNIQPVMYVEQNSKVAKGMADLLIHRRTLKKNDPLRMPLMLLKCFVKNTIGYNSYLKIDDFVFKQENEWRFIPTKKQIGDGYISESRNIFLKNRKTYNNRLLKYPLKFQIDRDVEAIFYDQDNDRKPIKDQFHIPPNKLIQATWK